MKIVDVNRQMVEKCGDRMDEVLSVMPDGRYYNQQTERIETARCIAITREARVIAFLTPTVSVRPIVCYVHPEKVAGNTSAIKTGTPTEVRIRRTNPIEHWDNAILAYNLDHCTDPIMVYHVLGEDKPTTESEA